MFIGKQEKLKCKAGDSPMVDYGCKLLFLIELIG